MLQINRITKDALQKHTVFVEETGLSFTMILYFMPMQYAWIIRELTYDGFTLRGITVVNSQNLLHQFKNKLPFGIICESKEGRQPSLIEDFESGYTRLGVINSSEVKEFGEYLSAQV